MINMTMTPIHKNNSSFLRQPSKQGSASEPIERTAWQPLFFSSCPIVVHWFKGSGWYPSTWHTKMTCLLLLIILQARLFLQQYKVSFKYSPQISRKGHHNLRSASSCLLQLRHEHLPMVLARMQVESMMVLHGGGWAQKRAVWIHHFPRQWWMPENVKSSVCQVSPWWKEEQHRRGPIFPGSWGSSSTKPLTLYLRQNKCWWCFNR